jgi:hypothetical protein
MSIIKPVQDMTHQLDSAYEALAADPQSLEKHQRYEQLRSEQAALLAKAQAQLAQAPSEE